VTAASIQRMEEALPRAVRGDRSAFESIVREHQGMVFGIAFHFLHDCARAEEVAQEVFFRLYQNLPAIKSAAHLMLWLRKVTNRRCIDVVRKDPLDRSANLDDVQEISEPGSPSDPLLSRRLRRLVSALPENYRMVIILRYQEELDLAEIAEILELPINTVKSRLQRSLAMLREKLSKALEVNAHETS
jgi:RNA polymerase sigma-70 factor (ECF subfamily)